MTNFIFAVKVWVKAVVINMVLITLGLIFTRNFKSLPFLFVIFILAILFTGPLLFIITQAVRIANRIPYSPQAKLAWLSFMLQVIGILFYVLIGLPFDASINDYKSGFGLFLLATAVSILCAVQLSRKSFKALNT